MISYLKYIKDKRSFHYLEKMGFPVYKVDDLEKVDNKIEDLSKEFSTIVISSELASFSENIIKKYSKQKDINIIIARTKTNE